MDVKLGYHALNKTDNVLVHMAPSKYKRFSIWKPLVIGLAVFLVVVVALGLLSHYWLPGYVKAELEKKLSQIINRPVTVQAIDFKPLTLELAVTAFHVGVKDAPDGSAKGESKATLLSFDRLYVDLSIESITQRAVVISAVTLESPHFYLVREQEDEYNITDILELFAQEKDAPEEEPKEILFSVSNIVIKDGHFELIDQFKNSRQKIADINLGIPVVANFGLIEESWVEPHFSAEINGAPFSLAGKLRPFADKREATLAVKLDDINLTLIDEYVSMPPGIHLLSGYFDSDLLVKFAEGAEKLHSVTVSGQIALQRLAYKNKVVSAPYHAAFDKLKVQIDADFMGVKPSRAGITLNNATITREGEAKPVLSLPELTLDNVQIDMAKKHIVLDKISVNRLSVFLQREQDGNIDLVRLFSSVGGAEQRLASSPPKRIAVKKITRATVIPIPGRKPSQQDVVRQAEIEKDTVEQSLPENVTSESGSDSEHQMLPVLSKLAANTNPWNTQVNRVQLKGASIHFNDTTLTKIAPMNIHALDLTLSDIDINGVKPLELVLQAKVNQHGSINTRGTLAWAPLSTGLDIDLKEVDLVSLQGWGGDQLNVLLTRGGISFQGKVNANGEPLVVSVDGMGKLSNFNLFDEQDSSDLLGWRDIRIDGLKFVNEPLSVDISSIGLDKFYARVEISPDGTLNLTNIVKQDKTAVPVASEDKNALPSLSNKQSIPVRIGKVMLNQGSIDFSDQFIKPNYRAYLTGLAGKIEPLHPNKSGKIEITGAVNKSAPLDISGTIDPFGSELLFDITAKAKNIDLPTFSPYSGKYIGYTIERGKLSVDVHYQIKDNVLEAQNQIFLDQLTLGEEIDSPDAPSLPLRLAVSLLKDRHGEIKLRLPIKGSVDDPKFSIGDILFDAFVNLITKAATAPFALLGSVIGGDQELSSIDFAPGYAKIEAEAEARLQTLSKALIDRPVLKLEITGYADSKGDHMALKRALLDRMVKAKKLTEDATEGKAGGSLEEVELDAEQYEEFLTMVYEEQSFEKPENMFGLTKSLPVTEMEELLLKNIEVSDEDFRELAKQRANSAQNWLIGQGAVSSDRIFILGAKVKAGDDSSTENIQAKFKIK